MTPRLAKVFEAAQREADTLKDAYMAGEHILLAATDAGGAAAAFSRPQASAASGVSGDAGGARHASASPTRTPRRSTRRCSGTGAI